MKLHGKHGQSKEHGTGNVVRMRNQTIVFKTLKNEGVSFVVLYTEIPKPCRSLKHLKDPKGVGFLRRYFFVQNPKTYPKSKT